MDRVLPRLVFPPDAGSRHLISPGEVAPVFALPLGLYLLNGLLVQLPNTRPLRIILLPFSLVAWYHAATRYTIGNPWFNVLNQGFVAISVLLAVRTMEWATLAQPLHKQLTNKRWTKKSKSAPYDPILSTLELCMSLRGIGWVQQDGGGDSEPQLNHQTRSTTMRRLYILQSLQSILLRIVLFDICHAVFIYSYPGTMGLPEGGSIYDCGPDCSPLYRFARATFLGMCTGTAILNLLTVEYDAPALIAVSLGGQDPEDWTPVFGPVWTSSSLAQLWNERWHQLLRPTFILLGGRPGRAIGGLLGGPIGRQIGGVLGAFAISGLLHVAGLWSMGRGTDVPRLMGYFMLQAVGIIIEGLWTRWTGNKIRGGLGWLWTVMWVIVPFQLVAEAWLTRGFMGFELIPDHLSPGQLLVKSLLGSTVDRSMFW